MIAEMQLSSLSNPLASQEQLSSSTSQLDGIPLDLENSVRYAGAQLTQAAGILLRLPQEIITQAIITFSRFYVGPEGGSFRLHAVKVNASGMSTTKYQILIRGMVRMSQQHLSISQPRYLFFPNLPGLFSTYTHTSFP